MKKRIIIIGVMLFTICLGTTLIGTFASNSTVASTDNTHTITLTGSTGEISVPSGTSKTVIYQITNTNKGVVKYGVAYSGDDIVVKVYKDTIDSETGLIDYGENKFVKLYIENIGDTDSIASIKTILGYEFGGDLDSIKPSGYTLVTEVYEVAAGNTIATHITNLYTNATKTTTSNNGITYNYASDVSIMNDRLGDANVDADSGNIRYYGANPNNYIYFNCEIYPETNCETWRIIGLFKDITMADGTTKDLVKIARSSTLSSNMAWDSNGSNNWYTSTLNTYFNGDYYNGLQNDETRDMIVEVVWNLGGWDKEDIYADEIYDYERGTEKCSSSTYDTTWPGKIALMYPSDYGYATDFSQCTQNLYNYDYSTCYTNDWLYQTSTYQWLLTPHSGSSRFAWYVGSSGYFDYLEYYVNDPFGARPVLYLDSEIGIESGDGSSSNPYRISVS